MTRSEAFWIIENHVSRMHVSRSNREIIRVVYKLIYKWTRKKPFIIERETRRGLYQHALKCHEKNFKLYSEVMRGF